jgi:hypothetical protein
MSQPLNLLKIEEVNKKFLNLARMKKQDMSRINEIHALFEKRDKIGDPIFMVNQLL